MKLPGGKGNTSDATRLSQIWLPLPPFNKHTKSSQQVLGWVSSYFCNEIWVPHNCPDEEAVVCHFSALLDPSRSQVQVHLLVGAGNCCQVKVPHSVELQLKRQSWLQISVNSVLLELRRSDKMENICLDGQCAVFLFLVYHYSGYDKLTSSRALNVKNFGNSLWIEQKTENNKIKIFRKSKNM